jgi:WD40 repeat protein
VADGPGGDTAVVVDTRSPALDGPGVDFASLGDAKTDVAIPTPDVSKDAPPVDLVEGPDAGPNVGPDLGPDGPVDAPLTTMNVLSNCKAYTHSTKDSTGAIEDWGIRQLAFSPDGANLISFGEDGRAKLWNVTAAGLVEPASGLVFKGGQNSVYGTISQDGNYVAVGDGNSEVTVYDLAVSIKYGAPSTKWSLPASALSVVLDPPQVIQFTTDGGHLVVAYKAYSPPAANPFAVWDLGTQKIVRLVNYDNKDLPMAVLPGSYTSSMWVASVATGTTDAGADFSTVTLMDVSQASPSKAQVTIDGDVYSMAFSPDGTTLAIGFYSGEVSLWDITTKSNIVRLGSPLIAASTSYSSAYALAYTPDGKYLAAGLFDFTVRLVNLQPKVALQKSLDYIPWSVAFAPDGLGLAVGERDYGVLLYCRP